MIIGVIGDRGSGKTLFMTREAHMQYLNGKKIYSNYKLKFPESEKTKKPELLPNEFFINYEDHNLKNCCLFLDEVYVYIDSRTSISRTNKIMSYFFNQTRKTGVDLYYSTQFFSQVDKRLRHNTERFVLPKAFKLKDNIVIQVDICNRDLKVLDKWQFLGKPYYNFYDTDEIIKFEF